MRQANLSCAAETTRRFDMRALMRLAGWGISAAVALLLAVLLFGLIRETALK
jgi:hypothetical protein